MKSRFVVIGLGRFGRSVALHLARWGYDVLGVDRDETRVKMVSAQLQRTIEADAGNPQTFKSLKLTQFGTAVVAMGHNLEASAIVTILLKQDNCPRVVVKAASDLHASVLKLVGADIVVLPEKEMGSRIARNLTVPNVLDYLALAPGYRVVEALAPTSFHDQPLGQLDLGAKHGLNVLAVKNEEKVHVAPPADYRIVPGDVLVVVGADDQIKFLSQV